jgi:hypothetical protein
MEVKRRVKRRWERMDDRYWNNQCWKWRISRDLHRQVIKRNLISTEFRLIAKIRKPWCHVLEFLSSDFRVTDRNEPLGVVFGCRPKVEAYKNQILPEAPNDISESAWSYIPVEWALSRSGLYRDLPRESIAPNVPCLTSSARQQQLQLESLQFDTVSVEDSSHVDPTMIQDRNVYEEIGWNVQCFDLFRHPDSMLLA